MKLFSSIPQSCDQIELILTIAELVEVEKMKKSKAKIIALKLLHFKIRILTKQIMKNDK